MTTPSNCTKKTHTSHGDAKIVLINIVLTAIKFFLKTTRMVFAVTNALTGIILIVLNYLSLTLNIIIQILMLTGHAKNVSKKFCKKCDASVFHKANINCCVCHHTYHFSCMKVPQSYKNDAQFKKNWICVNCKPTVFPFAKIDNKKVFEMSDHKLENFSRDNLSISNLSSVCRICEERLTKNNKGIPCSSCNSRIHIKCANTTVKDFHL